MPNKPVPVAGRELPANPAQHTRSVVKYPVDEVRGTDPLLKAIQDYRNGVAALNSLPPGRITQENEDGLVEAAYGKHLRRILEWDMPALSREGAIEALRLMETEEVFLDDLGIAMHRAVLRYLEEM